MAATIKTKQEIKIMGEAGKILASILEELEQKVKPGVSTGEIDELAKALCKKNKVEPAFFGYNDFPAYVCVGVDDVAVHGIPSEFEILEEGQILSIDMGIKYQGYYSDHAKTFAVGKIDADAQKLLNTTELAMNAAINQAVEGKTTGDIGFAMEQVAKLAGFSVIKVMTGHGIGKYLHEDPSVPCYGNKGEGTKLISGMTLAIEAMVNEGVEDILFDEEDGWTTVTADGKRSALFEHTVVVGKQKPEILTIR